jgi:hypothetical protein
LRNASIVKTFDPKDPKDEESVHFIHSTGGMFVLIPNYSSSYLGIRSRHSSANTATKHQTTTTTNTNESNATMKSSFENTINIETLTTTTSNKATSTLTPHSPSSPTKLKTINEYNTSETNILSSSSSLTTQTNNNNNSSANTIKRDRSNSKSQQIEFLRLNQKNYLNDSKSLQLLGDDDSSLSTSNDTKTTPFLLLNKPINIDETLLMTTTAKQSSKRETKDFFVNDSSDNGGGGGLMFQSKPFYVENEGCFVGFLWSWNFMLGKKWRSQFTGDEAFQDNMLADFRLFCSNHDGRLGMFFAECKNSLK